MTLFPEDLTVEARYKPLIGSVVPRFIASYVRTRDRFHIDDAAFFPAAKRGVCA